MPCRELTEVDVAMAIVRTAGGHLRTHGYGNVCAVQIPILNVRDPHLLRHTILLFANFANS